MQGQVAPVPGRLGGWSSRLGGWDNRLGFLGHQLGWQAGSRGLYRRAQQLGRGCCRGRRRETNILCRRRGRRTSWLGRAAGRAKLYTRFDRTPARRTGCDPRGRPGGLSRGRRESLGWHSTRCFQQGTARPAEAGSRLVSQTTVGTGSDTHSFWYIAVNRPKRTSSPN